MGMEGGDKWELHCTSVRFHCEATTEPTSALKMKSVKKSEKTVSAI